MNLLKRTYLGVVRRPFHAIVLLIIMVAMSTMFMVGNFINDLVNAYHHQFVETQGYSIWVSKSYDQEEQSELDAQLLSSIVSTSHVVGYNTYFTQNCEPISFENIPYQSDIGLSLAEDTGKIRLISNVDAALYKTFRNKEMTLIDGNYPNGNNEGVLIDSQLAKKNNISIGSSIQIYSEYQQQNIELKVVGIYETKKAPQQEIVNEHGECVYGIESSSYIFCDIKSYGSFEDITGGLSYIYVYVDDYEYINQVCEDIKSYVESKDEYDVINMIENEKIGNEIVINTLKTAANTILKLTYFTSTLVIFLLTLLWMRNHYYETGIYIGLGFEKWKIVLMFTFEIIVVSIIAFNIAIIGGTIIFSKNSSVIVDYIMKVSGVSFPNQAVGETLIKEAFSLKSVIRSSIITIVVSFLATFLSSMTIIQYNPRRLLAENKK